MCMPPHAIHTAQTVQLGEYQLQKARPLQQVEAYRRHGREHYLVDLRDDTLTRDDLDTAAVALDGLERLGLDVESQLRGEAHGPHHAQRIVREGYVGVARRADDAVLKIVHAVEGIHQLTEPLSVERPRQRVDGKVAPPLVVLQRTRLDGGFARVVGIGLLARPHELDLDAAGTHHGRPETSEYGNARMHLAAQSLRHGDAVAHNHDIHIGRGTPQIVVAHVAPHDVCLDTHGVDDTREAVEEGFVQRRGVVHRQRLASKVSEVSAPDSGGRDAPYSPCRTTGRRI